MGSVAWIKSLMANRVFNDVSFSIFLLESDPFTALALEQGLEEAGYPTERLFHYKSLDEVIENIGNLHVTDGLYLIDLDGDEGWCNGFEVVEYVRKKCPGDCVIAAISSSFDPKDIKRSKELGANAYVLKSFNVSDPDAICNRLLRLKADYMNGRTDTEFEIYD